MIGFRHSRSPVACRRTRRAAVLIGLLAALPIAVSPRPQAPQQPEAARPALPPAATYLQVVDRYRSGSVDLAARTVVSLDHARIEIAVKWLGKDAPRDAGDPDYVSRIQAAALLHAHVVLAGVVNTPSERTWHLAIAKRLVDLQLMEERELPDDVALQHRSFQKQWLLLVARYRHSILDLDALVADVAFLVARFGDDPEVLLLSGSFAETLAWPRLSSLMITPWWQARKSRNGWLEDARSAYQRAVNADPGLHEARLRLGHVFSDRGRNQEAMAIFESVLRDADSQPLTYLAHLFSGRVCERPGRLSDAVVHYRAAAAICPGCQVPLVAVSNALRMAGDQAAAVAAARAVSTVQPADVIDPFLEYYYGPCRDLLPALERMRREVSK